MWLIYMTGFNQILEIFLISVAPYETKSYEKIILEKDRPILKSYMEYLSTVM